MDRLVRRFSKYNIATFIIMGLGVVLFLLAPTGWGVGWDSDILGFLLFVIGLIMLAVGLIVGGVRSNSRKGIVVGIIAALVLCSLIGVVVYNNV